MCVQKRSWTRVLLQTFALTITPAVDAVAQENAPNLKSCRDRTVELQDTLRNVRYRFDTVEVRYATGGVRSESRYTGWCESRNGCVRVQVVVRRHDAADDSPEFLFAIFDEESVVVWRKSRLANEVEYSRVSPISPGRLRQHIESIADVSSRINGLKRWMDNPFVEFIVPESGPPLIEFSPDNAVRDLENSGTGRGGPSGLLRIALSQEFEFLPESMRILEDASKTGTSSGHALTIAYRRSGTGEVFPVQIEEHRGPLPGVPNTVERTIVISGFSLLESDETESQIVLQLPEGSRVAGADSTFELAGDGESASPIPPSFPLHLVQVVDQATADDELERILEYAQSVPDQPRSDELTPPAPRTGMPRAVRPASTRWVWALRAAIALALIAVPIVVLIVLRRSRR